MKALTRRFLGLYYLYGSAPGAPALFDRKRRLPMTPLDRCRSPVRRQVEAYEESWKNDHEALKVCWAPEDTISIGLATSTVLQRAERSWRDRVFRGAEEYTDEANKFFFGLNKLWLSITEHMVARAADLEPDCGTLEGADQLREKVRQAKRHLETWNSPRLSAAVGLREMDVPREAADALNRIVSDAKSSPPKPV
jgi:hypothetical protein